jgi:hypothetical protein
MLAREKLAIYLASRIAIVKKEKVQEEADSFRSAIILTSTFLLELRCKTITKRFNRRGIESRKRAKSRAQLPIEVTEHNHVNESRNSRITGTIQ